MALILELDPSGIIRGADDAKDALAGITPTARQTQDQLNRLGGAAETMGSKARIGGNAARMMAQQLSQVGQQTMATGNFVQALAIQLPDMGLAFGAVGAAAGLLAGIALPLLISALGGAGNAVKMFDDDMEAARRALSDFRDISDLVSAPLAELTEKFGSATGAAREYLGALMEITRQEAEMAASKVFSDIADLTALDDASGRGMSSLAIAMGLTTNEALNLSAAIRDLDNAKGIDNQEKAAQALFDAMLATYGSTRNMPPEMTAIIKKLAEAGVQGAELQGVLDQTAVAAGAIAPAAPGAGWLAGAIGDASTLTATLWDAYNAAAAAKGAASNYGVTPYYGPDSNAVFGAPVTTSTLPDAAGATKPAPRPNNIDFGVPDIVQSGVGSAGAAAIDSSRAAYDRLMASLDPVVARTQEMAEATKTVDDALKAGEISAVEQASALALIADKYGDATDAMGTFKDSLATAFDSAIAKGADLRGVIQGLIEDIKLALVKQALLRLIPGSSAGQSIGQIIIGGLFGGGAAASAPAMIGKSAMAGKVDEGGPGRAQVQRVEVAVMVDGEGNIKAAIRKNSIQAAQSGAASAVRAVRQNLAGWNNQLATDGALA